MALDDAHHVVGLRHELGNVFINDFAIVVFCHLLGLHHAAAHGGHLRTVVGVDNRGHDVAAESGTDLVEQAFVVLARLLVVVVADFERGAVGGKAAGERRADARPEVAADHRCAHEADLRLFLLEEVYENARVRL